MSQEDTFKKIQEVLESLRPAIKIDGGDVELVSFDKGIASVRLYGACATCPVSLYTLKVGIETQLKKVIPNILEVVRVE